MAWTLWSWEKSSSRRTPSPADLGKSGRLQTIILMQTLIGVTRCAHGFSLPSASMQQSGILSGLLLHHTWIPLSLTMKMEQTLAKPIPEPRLTSSGAFFFCIYYYPFADAVFSHVETSKQLLNDPLESSIPSLPCYCSGISINTISRVIRINVDCKMLDLGMMLVTGMLLDIGMLLDVVTT